jgi:hypothetical protein
MSIKFRPNENVVLEFTYDDSDADDNTTHSISSVKALIGPVINRPKHGWSIYSVKMSDQQTIDEIRSKCYELIPSLKEMKLDRYMMDYSTFKKNFKIEHVSEVSEHFQALTDQDLLNDLDFIKGEIDRIRINMNKLEQTGAIKRLEFFTDLVTKKQHTMFQFNSHEEYESYIDKIAKLIDKDEIDKALAESIKNVDAISKTIWNETLSTSPNVKDSVINTDEAQ